MDKTNETIKNVMLVRFLAMKGYREKVIRMITGLNQSHINKILNNKLHKDIIVNENTKIELTEQQRKRINTANKILACNEINSNDLEDDIKYLQLLRFFLIEKEDIYNMYNHWSKSRIAKYMLKKDVDILEFDSTLLGIERQDYLDLIIDFFIES